jgi:uncharacterized protein
MKENATRAPQQTEDAHLGSDTSLPDATIARCLRALIPGLQAVYRFGSTVSNETHTDSDIDVAFVAQRALAPESTWEAAGDLSEQLGRDVDLVDLRSASTVMRVQVLEDSLLLVDDDPAARAWFEMLSLSDYARLNEERRGILEDVRQRGHVYG